jgi:hypothetical protein
MKYFKDILSEVSQPKAPEEKRFKDQHEIETIDHPVALDSQFSGDIEGLTSKKREADYDKGEDQKAYDKAYKKKVSQTLPKRGTTITTDQEDVLEDIDLDALLDFNESEMTVEELDEVIGMVKKVANRFTTSGRADAAEKRADKFEKKQKDKLRLKKAKERLQKAKDAQQKLRQKINSETEVDGEVVNEASPTAWTKLRNDQRDRVRQEYQKLKAEYEKAQEKHDYHYNDINGNERTADRMMDRMEMIKDKQDKLVQKYGRGVYKAVGFRTGNRANEEMSITEILGFKNKTKDDMKDKESDLDKDLENDVEEDVCTSCKDPSCKDGKCEDIIEDDSDKVKEKDDSVDTNTSSLEDQPKEAPKVKAPKPSPTSVNIKAGGKNIQLTFKEMLDKVSSEDELLESPQEEIPMMLKQLQFICYASEEISEYLQSGVDPEEWWQNKLAGVFSNVKSLYAWSKGDQLVNKPLSAAAMFDKAGMKMHFEETEEELNESPVRMSGRNVKVNAGMLKTADGKRVKINKDDAKLLTDFFKNVKNVNNKKEMIDQLSQSEGGYKEVLTFAELS